MNRTAVDEIKARMPIDTLIGSYVKLEKSGNSFKAKCPFHNEKSPSFFVSPDRGGYYCFGCGAKGDIFSFVQQFEGLDFKGALKVLAERAGVKLVYDKKADSERDTLLDIMEEAASYYEQELAGAVGVDARAYLKNRGMTPATIKEFRIGLAPLGWKNVMHALKKKGFKESSIEKAGLIKMGDKGEYYDRFRGRVMFPITDSSGRVIAFTGRILVDDGKSAKYLNSPDTPLFDKSRVLFGLDKAKNEIRRLGYSILVEGQMDLVMSHQAGIQNIVASSGTALTPSTDGNASSGSTGSLTSGAANIPASTSNLELVKRLSPNLIIALDSDAAGRKATMRAVAGTALSMGMSVKIAEIEGGKDPADLCRDNPELWKNALKNSKHVVEFELNNVLREVSDGHMVARALRERIFPFLARIDSDMDKAYYVRHIAERTRIAETAVWEDLRKTVAQLAANKPGTLGQTSNHSSQLGGGGQTSNSSNPNSSRYDLVERRLFGLLAVMDKSKHPKVAEYRAEISRIAGKTFKARMESLEPILSDIAFEAEAFYGADPSRYEIHMKELMVNFEETIIAEELMENMGLLRQAENDKDHAKVVELVKKCQILSTRKSEIGKRR